MKRSIINVGRIGRRSCNVEAGNRSTVRPQMAGLKATRLHLSRNLAHSTPKEANSRSWRVLEEYHRIENASGPFITTDSFSCIIARCCVAAGRRPEGKRPIVISRITRRQEEAKLTTFACYRCRYESHRRASSAGLDVVGDLVGNNFERSSVSWGHSCQGKSNLNGTS